MRDTLHSLSERADEEHWSRYHRVLSEPIAYDGDVLEPDGDRAVDSIEFEFKSSPLRPTYINLPILSQSATISVSVNGQFLDRITVAASTRPLFHAFRWDVTDLTEGWTQSRLRIDISYESPLSGRVKILVGVPPQLGLTLHQPWSWSYGVPAIFFFAGSWVFIQSAVVLMFAHLPRPTMSPTYDSLLPAVVALFALIGIAWEGLPVRAVIRSVYHYVRQGWRLRWVLPLLGFLALFGVTFEGIVGTCACLRYRYSSLVQDLSVQSPREEDLHRAFLLFPTRIEGQLLISRHAAFLRGYDLRSSEQFKMYLRKLFSDPLFQRAVHNGHSVRRICLEGKVFRGEPLGELGVLRDPLLWYVQLLPGAEGSGIPTIETFALFVLRDRPDDPFTKLTRLILRSELTDNDIEQRQIARDLERLLRAPESDLLKLSVMYQEGWDHLAQIALARGEVDQAIEWHKAVLEVRIQAIKELRTPWLRPPNTLMLFNYFRYYGGKVTGTVNPSAIERILNQAPEFRLRLRSEIIDNPRYKNYKEDKDDSAWSVGTMLEERWKPGNKNFTDELLQKGWRY